MVRARLTTLETALGYQFKDLTLLDQALTHRSHSARHNERLEFLGDSVLNFVVAALLYTRFTTVNEGDLSRSRASLVKQAALADIAQSLKLSDYLRMGEGELKSGGFRRPSILSDALEAVFAAVLLDGGYQAAHDVIARQYEAIFRNVDPATLGKDPKTLLQEVLQARKMDLPVYTVIGTYGAAHDQSFEVQCEVPKLDIKLAAQASSRRAAEQLAAAQVIAAIETIAPAKGARTSRVRKAVQMALPDTLTQEKK